MLMLSSHRPSITSLLVVYIQHTFTLIDYQPIISPLHTELTNSYDRNYLLTRLHSLYDFRGVVDGSRARLDEYLYCKRYNV